MEASKIERVGKRIIFFGLLLFLFVPLIQNITHFKSYVHPLDGAFYPEEDISFSVESWFKGDYTSQKDKYIKENFGLHNYYVRLISQINFSLFKTTNVHNMIIGKNNYLYEIPYINAYYGRDFMGSKKIDEYIKELKRIQDTLQRRNKLILTVFAPGKASYYPEFIPDNFKGKKQKTNYEEFITAVKKYDLNHIDFYKYFNEQKNSSKYPLYPQLGIHWSVYGSIMAFDSITRYTESKVKIDLPDLEIESIEFSDSLKGVDNDAVKSLNLFKDPGSFQMAYPTWQVRYDATKHKKIKILVVADSFWWYLFRTDLSFKTYSGSSFWYYNQKIYPESDTEITFVARSDYQSRIREADLIIIMHSEATLPMFGGGFIEMCHETFFNPDSRMEKIKEVEQRIKGSAEWYKSIVESAKTSGLSVDSVLTLNAIYVVDQERSAK